MPNLPHRLVAVTIALCGSCLVGCDNDDDGGGIAVYPAPKDPPVVMPKAASTGQHEPIEWTLPAGWVRLPDAGPSAFGTVAKIQVLPDDPSLTLNVNVITSANLTGNVNRWRGQLGLPEMTESDMATTVKAIHVEQHSAYRLDLSGTDVKTNSPARMLAVLLPMGEGNAWSFLLRGPPEKIAALEPAFDAFVASVKFPSHNHGDDSAGAGGGGEADPHANAVAADPRTFKLTGFTVPPGWVKDETPRDVRLLTLYTGEGNDRGELMVTKFGANGFGTMLNNVNRWRREVGLPEAADEFGENVSKLEAGDLIGMVFDFAGPQRRSYVGIFRKGRDVWFVKLIGPAATVAAQRENYDALIRSFQFGEVKADAK